MKKISQLFSSILLNDIYFFFDVSGAQKIYITERFMLK